MLDKMILIGIFAGAVALVWVLSMLSTPHKGITKLLERTAAGAVLCLIGCAILAPFGLRIPQNPVSAVLTGLLGVPGMAFSTFLSLLP